MVKENKRLFRDWKRGGSREAYLTAKFRARREVYRAKTEAQRHLQGRLNNAITNQEIILYRVRAGCQKQCEIKLDGQVMEVNEYKYIYAIMSKHESMEGEIGKRSVHGSKLIRPLGYSMIDRAASMK